MTIHEWSYNQTLPHAAYYQLDSPPPALVDTSMQQLDLEEKIANQKYTEEFREEAVRQVLNRGYSVKDVAENQSVSAHSLYKWLKQVKPRPEKKRDDELLASKREILELKAKLRRAEEERDTPHWQDSWRLS